MAKIEVIVLIAGRPVTIVTEAANHEDVLSSLEVDGFIDGYSPGDQCDARIFRECIQAVFKRPIVVQPAPSIIVPGTFNRGH